MKDKLVTFVVAAYNTEKFLKKCLNSFLLLDKDKKLCEKRIEVLVINDGSTDRTEEIALNYQRNYPEIFRVITKVNGGHGSVINRAIKEASGKYFKVIDADDWIEKRNLKNYLDQLESCCADVVLTHYKTWHIKTKEWTWWKTFLEDYNREYTLIDIQKNWKSMDRCLTFHGITYRTEFYRKKGIKLIEQIYYEDHQYATIPCCYASSIQPFDCCLYIYRIGDQKQSVSDRNQYSRRADTKKVILTMEKYLKENFIEPTGKFYYEEKLRRLILSYMVTLLLSSPVRRKGYREVQELLKQIKADCNEVYQKVKISYFLLMCCSFMRISKKQYQRILKSRIYNIIRKNKKFQKEQ